MTNNKETAAVGQAEKSGSERCRGENLCFALERVVRLNEATDSQFFGSFTSKESDGARRVVCGSRGMGYDPIAYCPFCGSRLAPYEAEKADWERIARRIQEMKRFDEAGDDTGRVMSAFALEFIYIQGLFEEFMVLSDTWIEEMQVLREGGNADGT